MTTCSATSSGSTGVTITDALDMGALAQGADQCRADVRSRRLRAGGRPAARARRTATPGPGSRRRSSAPPRAAARRRPSWRRRPARSTRCGLGWARPGRRRRSTSWAAAGAPGARARSSRHDATHAGPRRCRRVLPLRPCPRRARAILAVMPRPADLTPADTSSIVAPGLAGAAAARPRPTSTSSSSTQRTRRRGHRGRPRPRARRAGGRRRRHDRRACASRASSALVEAVAAAPATGTPVVAVALRTPWDVAAYPAGVAARGDLLDPAGSLDALAAVLAGRDRRPARAAFPVGCRSRRAGRGPAGDPRDDPPRRDPRAARRSPPGSSRRAAGRRSGRSPPRSATPRRRARRHRRPRHARTTPRSTRSTCWGSGTGCRSGSARRRSSRSTAPSRGSIAVARHRRSASPAPRPTSSRSSTRAAARAPRPLAITNDPASPLAAAAGRTHRPRRRPGAGDRRDQDLHDRAAGDRGAVGGA